MGQPLIPNGYVLSSRKLLESSIMRKPPLYYKVWGWLLLKAQHKPYKSLKRGELITSIPEIIEAMSYKVGYRTMKPSKKQIWGILNWMREPYDGINEDSRMEPMIETTKVTHGLRIRIVNYDFYQNPANYEGNSGSNDEVIAKGTRRKRQGTNNNNNDNNVKNDNKKCNDEFEQIWSQYPLKKGKAIARESYIKLRDKYSMEELEKAVQRYSLEVKGKDEEYIKHGSTFFSKGYEDYLDNNYIENKQSKHNKLYKVDSS